MNQTSTIGYFSILRFRYRFKHINLRLIACTISETFNRGFIRVLSRRTRGIHTGGACDNKTKKRKYNFIPY